MRQPPASRQRAAKILAEEVDSCVRKRLVRAGWSFRKGCKGPNSHNPIHRARSGQFFRSWRMIAHGVEAGTMSVWSHDEGAMLVVSVNYRDFSQSFLLTDTASPRRTSCLLVQWLRHAQVRQVMTG